MGGLIISYEAFKKKLSDDSIDINQEIDGFTLNQRFFIAWAQIWKSNIRDELLLNNLLVDPHSPQTLRINEPLKNMPQFFNAFDIKKEI